MGSERDCAICNRSEKVKVKELPPKLLLIIDRTRQSLVAEMLREIEVVRLTKKYREIGESPSPLSVKFTDKGEG